MTLCGARNNGTGKFKKKQKKKKNNARALYPTSPSGLDFNASPKRPQSVAWTGNGHPAAVRWRGLIYQMLGIFKGIKLPFWGRREII